MAEYEDTQADRKIVRELFDALPHCDVCAGYGETADAAIATHIGPGALQLCEMHGATGVAAEPKPQRPQLLAVRAMLARWARPRREAVRCPECNAYLLSVPAREHAITDVRCGPEHEIEWADGAHGRAGLDAFEFAGREQPGEDPAP